MKSARLIIIALVIFGLLSAVSALVGWFRPRPAPQKEYVKVPEIKEVVKIKRVKVPVREVVTIEKEKIIKELKLPDWLHADQNKQVLTTGVIEPYEGKTNAAAVIDTQTGESQIIAQRQPLPLFGFESKREIGLRYGIVSTAAGGTQTELYGRWDFLRIGKMHLGAYAEINRKAEAKAEVNLSYKF